MKITAISDLHGYYPELPGGDLLILAGDYTATGKVAEWVTFYRWLELQDYGKKIYIGGNHDNYLSQCCASLIDECEYLNDSGTEFEGLKIWGCPWTLTFPGINPHCAAFTGTEDEIRTYFEQIPEDTDILITHGPPYGILDTAVCGHMCGSRYLMRNLARVCPRLHIFGHIHEGYGMLCLKQWFHSDTTCYNVSLVNERYEPVNEPIEIEL